jgi:hypothetical protein
MVAGIGTQVQRFAADVERERIENIDERLRARETQRIRAASVSTTMLAENASPMPMVPTSGALVRATLPDRSQLPGTAKAGAVRHARGTAGPRIWKYA